MANIEGMAGLPNGDWRFNVDQKYGTDEVYLRLERIDSGGDWRPKDSVFLCKGLDELTEELIRVGSRSLMQRYNKEQEALAKSQAAKSLLGPVNR